jgi:hypothetical protein
MNEEPVGDFELIGESKEKRAFPASGEARPTTGAGLPALAGS